MDSVAGASAAGDAVLAAECIVASEMTDVVSTTLHVAVSVAAPVASTGNVAVVVECSAVPAFELEIVPGIPPVAVESVSFSPPAMVVKAS